MTIKQKIQSLISAANETTGESDTDLTSAVSTLIDGYGQGGGTLITKNISANGTYSALDDDADGYSSVTVNITSENKLNKLFKNEAVTLTENDLSGVTAIEDYQFYHRSNMDIERFPDTITSIGQRAFAGCSNLTHLNVPTNLTAFQTHTWDSCTKLKRVDVDTLNHWLSITFASDSANPMLPAKAALYVGGNKLTSLTTPSNITAINAYAFHGCSSLTDIQVTGNVKSIGNYAFDRCSNLANITFDEGLETIGAYAFEYTEPPEKLIFPASLVSLGQRAFQYTSTTTEVVFLGKPTTIHTEGLHRMSELQVVRVPWSEGEVAGAPWGATNAEIVYNYVPITDLSGHTWTGNNTLSLDHTATYNASHIIMAFGPFMSYQNIKISDSGLIVDDSDVPAYTSEDGWIYSTNKSIKFNTTGSDLTNPVLIAWLEANGTIT